MTRTRTPPECALATGTSATPNPPSLAPSGGSNDYLWIASFGADDDDQSIDKTSPYWPLSAAFADPVYDAMIELQCATSGTTCMTAAADYPKTGSNENPPTMGMAASEEWVAATIAVYPGSQGSGAVGYVQSKTARETNSVTLNNITAGDFLVLGVCWWGTGNTTDTTITNDTLGISWNALQVTTSTSYGRSKIWYATSTTSGNDTVTIGLTGGFGDDDSSLGLYEYSGVSTSTSGANLRVVTQGFTSASFTPTAGDLVFAQFCGSASSRNYVYVNSDFNQRKADTTFFTTVDVLGASGSSLQAVIDTDAAQTQDHWQIVTFNPGGGGGGGNGYSYRRAITIDYTKVSSTLTNFPILVSSTISDWKHTAHGGDITDADGDDLIFTSDSAGETLLSFEREKYVSSTGAAYYWVKIPTLSNTTNTVIYAFYASSSITSFQSTASDVWDSNYKGVWHLAETSGNYNDSTANANNATTVDVTTRGAAGKIDGAADFEDSSTDDVSAPDHASLDVTGTVTLSYWTKPESVGVADNDFKPVLQKGDSDIDQANYGSSLDGDEINFHYNYDNTANGWEEYQTSNSNITAGNWYHVAITYSDSSNTIAIHVNGSEAEADGTAGAETGSIIANNQTMKIGAQPAVPYYYDGIIDEVRVSAAVRTSQWIKTEYNNQSSPSTFYTVGSEQTP